MPGTHTPSVAQQDGFIVFACFKKCFEVVGALVRRAKGADAPGAEVVCYSCLQVSVARATFLVAVHARAVVHVRR